MKRNDSSFPRWITADSGHGSEDNYVYAYELNTKIRREILFLSGFSSFIGTYETVLFNYIRFR
jgi:hypothetical protein